MKYRKKSIIVEAVQWTGDNLAEVRQMDGFNDAHTCFFNDLKIKTLEGVMHASIGDYIIRGVAGEFYPCKPDVFEATYELVDRVTPTQKQVDYATYLAERMCAELPEEFSKEAYSDFISKWKPVVKEEDAGMNEPSRWGLQYL